MKWLEEIVDKSLERMKDSKMSLRTAYDNVPPEMIDDTMPEMIWFTSWKPIASTITDADLDNFEQKLTYKLPLSYRHFLKYKHFCHLELLEGHVTVPPHFPDENLTALYKQVFEEWYPDLIWGRGYIHFADLKEHGTLCFKVDLNVEDNEYPVVYIDNENPNDIRIFTNNFKELLQCDIQGIRNYIEMLEYLRDSRNEGGFI